MSWGSCTPRGLYGRRHNRKPKTSKGELRYRCTVREHKGEEAVYRESRSFGRQSDAKSRRMQMAARIEREGLPGQVRPVPTIRELIALYPGRPAISPTIGRTKAHCLDLGLPMAISPSPTPIGSPSRIWSITARRDSAGKAEGSCSSVTGSILRRSSYGPRCVERDTEISGPD